MAISYQKNDSSYEDGPGPIGLGRYHEEETVVSNTKWKWLQFCNWFHNTYERCSKIWYQILPFLAVLSIESAIYVWAPVKQNALIVIVMANVLGLLVMFGHKIRNR